MIQRLLLLGCCGAGKTTLGRQLSAALDLPLVHLDQFYWGPGWAPCPEDQWQQRVRELIARPRWILDGNYQGTLELRLTRADTVVFLDLPRWRCMQRTLTRWLALAGGQRPDLGPGCPERLDPSLLRYVWSFPGRPRERLLASLEGAPRGVRIHQLRSPDEVATWRNSLLPGSGSR